MQRFVRNFGDLLRDSQKADDELLARLATIVYEFKTTRSEEVAALRAEVIHLRSLIVEPMHIDPPG
jgi:hypothetical protein